jgi:AcrR family transcriptional regulator
VTTKQVGDAVILPNRREQKKQSTFAAIVDAATDSFDDIGYDDTSMDAIAQSCGVSAGTVYNYFGTKSAILAEIVTRQVDEIMRGAAERLDLDAGDPVDALMPVLEIYLNQMTGYGSDVLKELFRAGFDPAHTELLADFVSADERVLVQLGQSLRAMRSRGLLSSTVDVDGATILVYSIVALALMVFTSIPCTTPVQVIATCESQLRIAFAGLAAR